MNKRAFVIVGDDYASFADEKSVFTVSQFFQELLNSDDWCRDADVIVGQGINIHTRECLEMVFKSRSIANIKRINPLAPLTLTHKRSDDNVLITTPEKAAHQVYRCELALNDKRDRLSDHVTGQHVGAMLLMEAARQATIAVLELEFMDNHEAQFGLILEKFDSKFDGYMFPLPTSMRAVIYDRPEKSEKNIAVTIEIEFVQSGSRICNMSLNVLLYPVRLLEKIESRKGRKAIDALLSTEISTELLEERTG